MRFTTAADVDRLPVRPVRYEAVDTEVPGVRVRVTPTGAKSFSFLYRIKGERRKRRLMLGSVRAMDLASARRLAKEHAAKAASGADPADARRAARLAEDAANAAAKARRTLAELGPLYLDHAAVENKGKTMADYRGWWNRYVVPALGKLAPDEITKKDVAALHRALRAKPTTANRVLSLVSSFVSWCIDQGLAPEGSAPTRRVRKYPERKLDNFLNGEQLARLLTALDTAERTGLPAAPKRQRPAPPPATAKHAPPPKPGKKNRARGSVAPANPYAVNALRLLLLTGWREQEVLTLRWDAVDLERGVATLDDTKAGQSRRVLSAAAVALLTALPRHDKNPWCFPSPRTAGRDTPPRPLTDVGRLWDAVRHAAKLEAFRLHDLRHSAASFAIGAGASLPVIGKMLGHKNSATTARYAHLADDPVRAAADAVAATVKAATAPVATKVTPLRLHRGG